MKIDTIGVGGMTVEVIGIGVAQEVLMYVVPYCHLHLIFLVSQLLPEGEMLTAGFYRTKTMNISEDIETGTLVRIAIGHAIDERKIHFVQAGGTEM